MNRSLGRTSSFLVAIAAFMLGACSAAEEHLPQDGERIVILGSEFIEQQIKFNFLEANLITRFPDKNIRWRNLGWSGDTPTAIARGYFNGEREGFQRLKDELDRLKPTMIIVCYGANSAPATFAADFERLFVELKKRTEKIVVVSHPAAEPLSAEQADVTEANLVRADAAATLQKFVAAQDSKMVRFVDLFAASHGVQRDETLPWTHDTIRFNEHGYRQLADALAAELSWSRQRDTQVDADWPADRFAQLRELLRIKNDLYFHRYRPQNETYLRGFRKHEQGQNAKEIAQFDALIDHAEKRITAFALGKPLPEPITEPDDIKLAFEAATIAEEKASFRMAEGLEIDLFAAEPMVANPIHMNFDAEGRLWVATSPIYPQIKPGAKAKDEIVVLEDTDGDGKADKRTVFADDLLIPTAVLPDEMGGAYVANSTEVLHLQDTDGDGKADTRKVVLAGFGTEDTHHILHTFRWGPDATLYFNQSIYIHTHMETPQGVRRLMGSGIWRFEPKTVSASILMRGLVNPWGHIFDDWGQSFATDGAGGNGINYAFPGSAYPTAVGYREVMQGMNPGSPKYCGLEIISGTHFPESWNNTLVTNDFRGNRIVRFQLSELDSGYASKQLPDLMTSSHRAFRPVDVKMAPDGSMMIADWYNPIINHGEVDFRDARRDYKHGRIWRVTVKDRGVSKIPDFKNATMDQLVEMLLLPERWSRDMARVEIKNRIGRSDQAYQELLAQPLARLLESTEPREQLAGLWTLAAAGQLDVLQLEKAMLSTDHHLRAAAVRIMADSGKSNYVFIDRISKSLVDSHPQVRLEAINAWRVCCAAESVAQLLQVLDYPVDKNIEFLLGQTLNETQTAWARQLGSGDLNLDNGKLFFVLDKTGAREAVAPLLERLSSGSLSATESPRAIGLIAQHGSAAELAGLFAYGTANPELRSTVLATLVNSIRSRRLSLNIEASDLKNLFDDSNGIQLIGLLRAQSLKPRVLAIAQSDEQSAPGFRLAAIKSLAAFSDSEALTKFANNTQQPLHLRSQAIIELATLQPNLAVGLASNFIASSETEQQQNEAIKITQAFLQRRNGSQLLTSKLLQEDLPQPMADLLIAKANGFGREGQELVKAMRAKLSAVENIRTRRTAADLARLVTLIDSGDPVRGESIYRRPKLNCIKCHAIGGAGGVVGPDMISLGASSPRDYIVQSLIEPNAKIKEGYHTTTVITADGQQVSGKLISELSGKIVMRDADDKEYVFSTDDIEGKKISEVSLMPAELTDELTDQEFADLSAFLCELGKEGPFKVPSQTYARRWIDAEGVAVTAKVDGSLPMADLKGRIASFEFEVTKPGAIGFEIDNPNGLRITLNDLKDNLRAERVIKDLPLGKHRLNFEIMNKANRKSLRVRLFEPRGSTGSAVVVNQ